MSWNRGEPERALGNSQAARQSHTRRRKHRHRVAEARRPKLDNLNAWEVADQLGWSDTFDAEYVALAQVEADALITLDRQLADAVKDLVTVAPIEALF